MGFRVLSAQIAHETNTFSVKPTALEDFRARSLYYGPDVAVAFRGTGTEMGAHLDAARRYGWELVQPLACSATPSGPVRDSAWVHLRDVLLDAAAASHCDGVLLALHGAMVAESESDAEGALLEGLRQRLGAQVPIVVTVDLHANVSDRMALHADALLAYRTYPHVDQWATSMEAAALLQQAMSGAARGGVHVWRLPTLEGCDFGRSGSAVMKRLLAMAQRLRASEPRCRWVAVCAGFPWADVPFAGPSVTVSWAGEGPPDDGMVAPMLDALWETRTASSVQLVDPASAARRAAAWSGDRPLVLADFTDNPGGGGYGDSVNLLRALLAAGVRDAALACVTDPEAAAHAIESGPGTRLAVRLGSRVDPDRYGPPLHVQARVESVSDGRVCFDGSMMRGMSISMGPTAVLAIDGFRVIVCSHNVQVFDRQVFLSQGIDPVRCRVLVVKSAHHFRSDFEPIAGGVLLVDAGGLVTPDLRRFPYRFVRRPVWPLDPVTDRHGRSS